MEGLTEGQLALQFELSCMADGEQSEAAAAQALLKIENDAECRAFFEDIQRCARLHRDVMDPERISARIAMLAGDGEDPAALGLNRRLAAIFYQLGKAYVLSAVDPDRFREQVFQDAVPIRSTKNSGRGFVDGVLSGGRSGIDGDRWAEARHLFNGRLERIQDPIEKGVRLLEQALDVEPDHEEARIYLAYVHGTQGRHLQAERLYREVFDTAMVPENRGHAAMQLGQLFTSEKDHRQASVYYRWVTLSGLAEQEPRFWPAYFNMAIGQLGLGRTEASLYWFRKLLDQQAGCAPKVAAWCMDSPTFRDQFDRNPDFVALFERRCPELFTMGSSQGGQQ
ncbi:MAG: hypothetical protein R3F17_06960 [Planctomycetota bacterium]